MIVGCIYHHLHMDLNKSNDYYINNLLHKLLKKNIEYDFNIDSLKYDQHSPTNDYLESPSSHMLIPHVVEPTRMISNSKTLIDKIYSKVISQNSCCHS